MFCKKLLMTKKVHEQALLREKKLYKASVKTMGTHVKSVARDVRQHY